MSRPTNIRVTSKEEGMPTGRVFQVIGWTGFDQPVVQDDQDGVLLVLQPSDFDDAGFAGMRPGLADRHRAQWEELTRRSQEIKRLREFVQFVVDHSNDPAVVREAKLLGAVS